MKNKIIFALFLCITTVSIFASAVLAALPSETSNATDNHYNVWADTVKSYLYEENGGFVRVEYISKEVVVERYDEEFKLLSKEELEPELPIWGGFYAGSEYNFLVYGQTNKEEDDNKEVIRVVKYDKSWNRISHASLCGANTTVPFDAGSLRCAEYGGYLYVHTCHKMYKSMDGLNHQSSLSFCVSEDNMKITDEGCCGYVSHSFNQFIMVDNDSNIITIDHGDGYPRAAIMFSFGTSNSMFYLQPFDGETGDNWTGATLGGLAETDSGYTVAYSYGSGTERSKKGDIYFVYTAKNGFPDYFSTRRYKLTDYEGSDNKCLTPMLVQTENGGYIMWNEVNPDDISWDSNEIVHNLCYAKYSENGTISKIKKANGVYLSDCQPIYSGGKVIWYAGNGNKPVFYTLDDNGITADSEKIKVKDYSGSDIEYIPNSKFVLASGEAGDNITYQIDGNLNLTFSGYGDMYDLSDVDDRFIEYSNRAKRVIINDGITSIGNRIFSICGDLQSVKLPESLTSIGDSAFSSCDSLKAVNLPKSLTSIGDSAFSDCNSLETVNFSEGLTSIGDSAFSYCDSLKTVNLPEGLTSIGDYAFCYCNLTNAIVPSTVTQIGKDAFYNNYNVYFDGTPEQLAAAYGENTPDISCLMKTGGAEFTEFKQNNQSIIVSVLGNETDEYAATMFLVEYADNKIIATQVRTITLYNKAVSNFRFPVSGNASEYRVFLWDNEQTMRPVCEPAVYRTNE